MIEFFEKLFFEYENTFWRKTLQSQDFLTHYTCGDCYGSTKDLTKTCFLPAPSSTLIAQEMIGEGSGSHLQLRYHATRRSDVSSEGFR